MKPGQIVKTFKTKKGNGVTLRAPRRADVVGLMSMMNSVVAEDDYIGLDRKLKLKQEQEWLNNAMASIKSGNKVFLLATVSNETVGSCDIDKRQGRMSHTGNFGIVIKDGYREEGIGSVIAKEILRLGKRDLKLRIADLEVYGSNKRAIGLYKKLGFKKYGAIPNGARVGNKYVDVVKMYREL